MKVLLIAAITADGKIAETTDQRSLDWTSKEDLKFFIEKTKEAGVVIMGRKTYETFGKPLKGRRLIVMSSKGDDGLMDKVDELEAGVVEYSRLDIKQMISKLEAQGYDQVVVAGGASVYGQFLEQELVTDVYLNVHSILFGAGVPLATGFERVQMKLEDVSRLGEQEVLLHYTV
ncbi:dihydrofolate reductase [Candidatus Uhrbacteria bacterium]|jgi:dihydrofolate reductase|nr:dihydrofolate reductase [Candidatus Uhrbacteria bacterium]